MASMGLKFWTCSIYFYVIFFAVSGLFLGCCTTFVLIQGFGMKQFYDPIETSVYFLYAPTFLIFIIAGIGWKAVSEKNIILLKCFSVSQIAVISLEMIGSIWNYLSIQVLHENALPLFQENFSQLSNLSRSSNYYSDAWDTIQRKLKCCGIHGAFDYKTLKIVPFSCCNLSSPNHVPAFCVSVHHVGCLDAFTDHLSQNFAILATVSATVALFQIPGVFASWCIATKIKKDRELRRKTHASNVLLLNRDKKGRHKETFIQETVA